MYFVAFIYIYSFMTLYGFYKIHVMHIERSILSIVIVFLTFNLLIGDLYEKIAERVILFKFLSTIVYNRANLFDIPHSF